VPVAAGGGCCFAHVADAALRGLVGEEGAQHHHVEAATGQGQGVRAEGNDTEGDVFVERRIERWSLQMIDWVRVAPSMLPPIEHPVKTRGTLLPEAYARTIRQTSDVSGRPVDVVHIVGGGSQNGPVEATALGNVLIQARAIGAVYGSFEHLRALVIASTALTRYKPR
jgi:hypothetical protein